MNESGPIDKLLLAVKAENVRSDERGSLTLLAGMMVFLATIFAIIAFDTNRAIYDRIVAQNAVDAAADSAALWQARFCNVEQQLNNLHYTVDTAGCVAEGLESAACITGAALFVLQDVPIIGEAAAAALPVVCVACDLLCPTDAGQHAFYNILMPVQQAIVDVAPFLVFAYANVNAYGSGADNIFDSASQTVEEYISDGVSLIPGTSSSGLQSTFSSVNSVIGETLGNIPIYAIPLDPTALQLYVNQTNNDGSPPLFWPSAVPLAGDVAGEIGCEEDGYAEVQESVGYTPEGDDSREAETDKPKWGWNDDYFKGNPGYMTWIAGVTNRNEILNLGNLVWLNSSSSTKPTTMYTGSFTGSGSLTIPAYIAIASSQVEGTPVVCNGSVDAAGKLIRVYFPTGTNNPATELPFPFTIYH